MTPIRREFDELDAWRKKQGREYKRLLWALQDRCPHEGAQFQGDPAGGRGSSWYCSDCELWSPQKLGKKVTA